MTPIEQRLYEAIQGVIRETRGFNERKQEAWCKVCRYKPEDRLHDPECSIYELHGAFEDWAPIVRAEAHDRKKLVDEAYEKIGELIGERDWGESVDLDGGVRKILGDLVDAVR